MCKLPFLAVLILALAGRRDPSARAGRHEERRCS